MSDYQDENPYASPQGAVEPATLTVEEIHGVWRDGDEMVLLSGEAKLPKACCVTNRSRPVWHYHFFVATRITNVMFASLCVPVIGIGLVLIAYLIRQWIGVRRETAYIWIPPYYVVWEFLSGAVFGLLVSANILLSNLAVFFGMPGLGLIAAALVGLQMFLFPFLDGACIGLPYCSPKPGIIRVRGVHPDYLARLPVYSESDIAHTATARVGEQPSADSMP